MSNLNKNMIMMLGLVFLLLQFYSAESEQRTLGLEDNVYCRVPRPSVVAVAPQNNNYFPYFVTLHRCVGSWYTLSPDNRRCTATKWEEVKTNVYSIITGRTSDIYLKNHTQCGYECVKKPSQCNMALEYWDEEQCGCGCKYPNPEGPPTPCKKEFKWSTVYCKCLCNKPPRLCPIRQQWSSEVCGCTCKDKIVKQCASKKQALDHDTCLCVDVKALMRESGGSAENARMYITLLALQFCVIVVLVFVLVHWVRKKRCPQVPSTVKYAKASNRDSTDTLNSDSTGKKDSDAGSITIRTEEIERQNSERSDASIDRETDL